MIKVEGIPLTNYEILNTLWKLTTGYKALKEVFEVLGEQVDWLTEQLVTHRLVEFEKPKFRMNEVIHRLKIVEEDLDGLTKHYTDTLKKKEALSKSQVGMYTIK